MKSARRSRQGMATLVAVALVGIAGAAAALLTASIAADSRRTQQLAEDAQVRQLLLAGFHDVIDKSAHWEEAPSNSHWNIPLPPDMKPAADGSKELSVKVEPPLEKTTCMIQVQARFGRRHGSEQIQLQRTNDRWQVTQLTLGE